MNTIVTISTKSGKEYEAELTLTVELKLIRIDTAYLDDKLDSIANKYVSITLSYWTSSERRELSLEQYNSRDHDIYEVTSNVQEEIVQFIEDLEEEGLLYEHTDDKARA